ncbi:MAG TPA: hypothetical protein VEC11_07700 [Allosphingosinicella sp.]|nr:hypothetical protein [Allosphingosinicella sp.]
MAYEVKVPTSSSVAVPLWRALRGSEAPRTVNELHRASRAHPNAIQQRLKRWSRVGLVVVTPAEAARYEISDKGRLLNEAPTLGSLSADAWAAMRRLGRPATFAEILEASGASDRPLYCRLRRWKRSGYVRELAASPQRFALAPEAFALTEPPTVNQALAVTTKRASQRGRMWAAMRILKQFDIPLLILTAEVTRRSAEDFINLLSRAGYVSKDGNRVIPSRSHGVNGNLGARRDWSTYRLVRNTGPKSPIITNSKGAERRLVDRNNGQSVPLGQGLQSAREAKDGQ